MRDNRQSGARENEGQALIQVALAMVVLLAFVGLAVDAGMAYAQRRYMQNAADAAALAGAYELCFGTPASAEATARQYAIQRNRAQAANVNVVGGWRVEVEASTVADTFLSGIIGVDRIPVAAKAAAACSGVRNLCNVWPLTFNQNRFVDIPCGQRFYVWNDNSLEDGDLLVQYPNGTQGTMPVCELCDCQVAFGAPDGNTYLLSTANRGWVNFPRPDPPYSANAACTDNCGINQTVCIISGGYNAPIDIPPGGLCLPAQTGVANAIVNEIDRNLNQQVNLLLWDRACTTGEPITGTCNASENYHITGTGCFIPRGTPTVNLPKKAIYRDVQILSANWLRNNAMCARNIKTVLAEKSCSCSSTCGSTIGSGPPQPWEVRGVSLIDPSP